MDVPSVINELNKLLALEYAGVIQNLQHSFLVQDVWREVYADYFRKDSEECLTHAKRLGEKIVALGGVPSIEPASIQQSTDLNEMLLQDLELEREALSAYKAAYEKVQDDIPLRFMVEEFIYDEQRHWGPLSSPGWLSL